MKYSLVDQFNQISFCLWVNGVIFRNFYVCLSQRWEILPRKYLFINFFFFSEQSKEFCIICTVKAFMRQGNKMLNYYVVCF